MFRLLTALLITFLFAFHISAQKTELVLPIGYSGSVDHVSFSPDGKYVLGLDDDNIKLWEVNSGKEIRAFRGHIKTVNSAYFSPDGKYVVSSSDDGTLKLWETASGQLIRTFKGKNKYIKVVRFSPNGNYLLSVDSSVFELWDVKTGRLIRAFKASNYDYRAGSKNETRSIAFSPNGNLALSGGKDKVMTLWDLKTGRVLRTFAGHKRDITSVSFSPDGKLTLSASTDKTIKLWNIKNGKEIRTFQGEGEIGMVFSAVFSPDGKYVASGSTTRYSETKGYPLKLWDVKTGKVVQSFKKFKRSIGTVSFRSDGKYLLAGSHEVMYMVDVNTGELVRTFKGSSNSVMTTDYSQNGKLIASGGFNHTIKIWDVATGKHYPTLKGHSGYIRTLALSSDNKYVVSGSNDRTVKLWDIASGKMVRALGQYNSNLTTVAFSPNGKYVVSGSNGSNLKVVEVSTGMIIHTLGFGDRVNTAAFSPDGKYIVVGGWDDNIKLWEMSSGKEVGYFEAGTWVNSLAFDSSGKYLVSAQSKTIKLWDFSTRQEVQTFRGHTHEVNSVAISKDGKYVLSGGMDKTMKLWNTRTGQAINTFKGHNQYVNSVVFSPDGRYGISGSNDNSQKIWDLKSGKELVSLYSLDGDDWVVLTPDGRFDASQSAMKKMYYVKGLDIIPLDALYEKYYTPNLLIRLMSGTKMEEVKNIQNIQSPPLVKITSPENNFSTQNKQITITVKATDQGGGVDQIRLYQNGKLISGTARGFKKVKSSISKSFEVTLGLGENIFKAVALSNDRIESNPDYITVNYTGAKATSELFLLVIGINNYRNPKYNLNYATADADAFQKQIQLGSSTIFKSVHPTFIKDNEATKLNIKAAFEKIKSQAGPEDMLVFYYAGHGVMNGGLGDFKKDFYLIPFDVTKMYGADDKLADKGISSTELSTYSQNIKAHKQVFILDACQSGGALDMLASRGAAEEKAIAQLARSTGTYWLAASGSEQFATEFKELGHGAFTYAILDGLKGAADGGSKDKKITAKELGAFIEDKVPELTEKHKGQPQFPTSYGFGQDFPMVIVK